MHPWRSACHTVAVADLSCSCAAPGSAWLHLRGTWRGSGDGRPGAAVVLADVQMAALRGLGPPQEAGRREGGATHAPHGASILPQTHLLAAHWAGVGTSLPCSSGSISTSLYTLAWGPRGSVASGILWAAPTQDSSHLTAWSFLSLSFHISCSLAGDHTEGDSHSEVELPASWSCGFSSAPPGSQSGTEPRQDAEQDPDKTPGATPGPGLELSQSEESGAGSGRGSRGLERRLEDGLKGRGPSGSRVWLRAGNTHD